MGFSIGRFLGAIAAPIGALIAGPPGAAVGAALGGALTAGSTPGRVTQPTAGAAAPFASQVPPLTSTVPIPNRLSFGQLPSTTNIGMARLPQALGVAGSFLPSLFGPSTPGKNRLQTILAAARQSTGGPVTRNNIIDAAKVCGLEVAAQTFGLSVENVCFVVVKGRSRRRRGISAADIRRTKRTIRFVKSLRKDLMAVKGR